MNDTAVTALIAAISAIVGGFISAVIGPVIKHRLEQSSAKTASRREQIRRWREMVVAIDRVADGDQDVGPLIHIHPEYLSLEPHLTEAARLEVHSESRTIVVGQTLAEPLECLKNEISRIEQKWKLLQ